VKAVEGGFGIVENPDVSASSVVTSTFTLPTAQTTNAKADIEKEKASITNSEFTELKRLAKFFLENPKEPTVSGSVVTRYPALFKAVTDIERRRQEELIETPRAYSDPTMGYTIQYLVENGIIEGPIVKPGTNTYLRIKEGVDKLNAEINAKYDAELKALEEQQASSETTIQQTITIEELAQQQEAAAIGVGPSKLAREYIDRILNSKTEKEALEIFREAEPQLKPADLPYLQTAGATARKNNQWVDPTKISDIVLAQVAAGDVFMRIEDNILFQAELKEDKIILKQIDGKSSVILSEDNKNQFMRSTDLNKTKPEVKEEPIIVSEESKQLVLNNIDEVSEFIKNSEKLTNLKEEVTSVDLDKLEDDLLNNLDC
jgi:hypothetical protein